MEGFITELIGNYVFPIVMTILLFWKMDKQDKDHKSEVHELTTVIEQNTLAITKLLAHMNAEEE